MVSFFVEKIFGALLLLIIPLITGLVIPGVLHKSHRHRADSRAIEFLNALATGLLMGTFLLHLLPESTHDLRVEIKETQYHSYPVGELLLGLGFFIILTIELAIVSYQQKVLINRDDGSTSFDELDSNASEPFGASYNSTVNGNPMFDSSFQHSIHSNQETTYLLGPVETTTLDQILSSSKVYVLLFGLSVHSFFEGIVIGLESKHWELWTIIFVVLLHKSIIASALGISAFRVFLRFKDAFNVMLIFGLASPIGVLCGGALRELLVIGHITKLILASLNCVASGSFLFVIFMELLPELMVERKSSKTILLIFIGFSIISLIELLCFLPK